MTSRKQHLAGVAAAAVIVFLAGATGVVVANHQFPDVATGSAFHAEVESIVDAGVATGFPDGTFRPKDPINRQQAAAWFQRGLGRAARAVGTSFLSTSDSGAFVEAEEVTIRAGGAEGGSAGFVLVSYGLRAQTSHVGCPCPIDAHVTADDQASDPRGASHGQIGENTGFPAPPGFAFGGLSGTTVFPVAGGEEVSFQLRSRFTDADEPTVQFIGEMTAVYVPFGAQGTDAP